MQTINAYYDQWVKTHPEETAQIYGQTARAMGEADCRFGNGVIPFFLKPFFIAADEEDRLRKIVSRIGSMLEKAVRAYFVHPELKPLFKVPHSIRPYVEADPGYADSIVVARPDAFVVNGVYRFLEFNCDSPAGAAYTDVQERIFRATPMMRDLARVFPLKRTNRLDVLLKALLRCYREYGGRKKYPVIAIVDWKTVKTWPEFQIIRRLFESRGCPTVVADPREMKLRGGALTFEGQKIDLVYRRVISRELFEKKDRVRDFLKAYVTGKVCVVNPLRSALAANKAILSILTNGAYNYLFSEEEIKARDKHLPWTRLVIDVKKFYGGKKILLTKLIDENRRNFVLKPADGYGGWGVTIGRETSVVKWRQTIQRALRGSENWVVQEYVPIPELAVPVIKGKKAVLRRKKININPYSFGGRYAGSVARLSDASVINVSNGGGLVPSVAYRRKSKR